MKKSVIFLINGLGIEKPGSYSISIDQAMPNLARTKETSFFTTGITSSLELKTAYQRFLLGDTYKLELKYIKENLLNDKLSENTTYQSFKSAAILDNKLHIFVEPTNDKVVEQINYLINTIKLPENKKIYLHLILTQQTIDEYQKLIDIVNYIKYHINEHITVGFVIGKESISIDITKEELDYIKKLFFMCSAERWTETDKKLLTLKQSNIRPCDAKGFCANNDCFISNNDTILFFNTRGDNYDNFIRGILENAPDMFKEHITLYMYSIVKLNSKYTIPFFIEKVEYNNSLSNILTKHNKKAIIYTDEENLNLINFYANGLQSINNPVITFSKKDDNLYNTEYIKQLIDTTPYDLFIFDYHMDTSSTINHLKEELSKLDKIIYNLTEACVNKHSLFISSIYGLKKEMPIAEYNSEIVLIDYQMQIPIFIFDYTYPKSKYDIFPGDSNHVLISALKDITNDEELDSVLRPKTLVGSIIKSFVK